MRLPPMAGGKVLKIFPSEPKLNDHVFWIYVE